MADLPDPKWGLLERPVLPTIRHVFRGPRDLCNRYIKVAEIILGKLRNSMSLGDVELATRGIRLVDGTKIRVLRDPSSDILYIDTTETVYAPYQEFPYFDFSFIPKEHYTSPTDDDGRSYLLGTELLPLSDSNPTPKRPMWGYHYTGHPYWKGLPDEVEVYQSKKAILWGNQFHFDAKGRNLVSWWHSPGGDLPIPIIRPGDYRATRGTSVFTLDVNGYLTAVDLRDGPPVYTPFHTTIRRQIILPNGTSTFTLPEFRFGHFTADYRFTELPVQLYRNNKKWTQYDDLLQLIGEVPYISGYTQCKAIIDNVLVRVSDFLIFPIDILHSETAPVTYLASFSSQIEGYPTATIELNPVIAASLGLENAFIDQEITYPWRFNSTGAEAMWIAPVGDRVIGDSVRNIRLVWFVFSIDPKTATIHVIEHEIMEYAVETISSTTITEQPPVDPASGDEFSYSSTSIAGDCNEPTVNLDRMNNLHWWSQRYTGTVATTADTRTITDSSSDVPVAYSYSKKDERIIARLSESFVAHEEWAVTIEDGIFERYEKATEPIGGYFDTYPYTYVSFSSNKDWVECFPDEQPGRYFCVGESVKERHYPLYRDVRWIYRDNTTGSVVAPSISSVSLKADNGLDLVLIEMESTQQVDSMNKYEDRNPISSADNDRSTISIHHDIVGYGFGCGPDSGGGFIITTDYDRYERVESEHGQTLSSSINQSSISRNLTYLNLTHGLVEYKEFEYTYTNSMAYEDISVDYTGQSIINTYRKQDTVAIPNTDTGVIYTTTYLDDTNVPTVGTIGSVNYELTIRSVIHDYINDDKRQLYELAGYSGEENKSVGTASFTPLSPANYGNHSEVDENIFYVGRLRRYLDNYSSFSGMVDSSNVESMRYLYSELHEKAYQMYLHDPVVLEAFFGGFGDQFVCGSGIETNTPERDFLLGNLPVTEEHRSLYPIALVRNRARVYGKPPTRVEKIKA